MVGGVFFPEFRHLYSPNLFISDTVCYLRLEKAYNRECVLQVVDTNTTELFEKLFIGIWNGRNDVVISDRDVISARLKHLRHLASIMDG